MGIERTHMYTRTHTEDTVTKLVIFIDNIILHI